MPKCGQEPGTCWPVGPGALTGQERAGRKGQLCFFGKDCQRLERRLLGHLGGAVCPTPDPDITSFTHTSWCPGEAGADLCPRKGALGRCLKVILPGARYSPPPGGVDSGSATSKLCGCGQSLYLSKTVSCMIWGHGFPSPGLLRKPWHWVRQGKGTTMPLSHSFLRVVLPVMGPESQTQQALSPPFH